MPSMFRKFRVSSVTYLFMLLDLVEQERQLSKSKNMQHIEKQHKAAEIVRNHVGFSLGAALVPFPGADLLAVSAVQLNMLRQLAKLYEVGFLDTLGKNIISAVVGGSAARLGASLVKAIPGVGTIIGEISMPVLSGASTYALGRVVANHFDQGGTLADIDLRSARKKYEDEIEQGKKVAADLKSQPEAESADDAFDKLKKLAELRDTGVITEAEFAELKKRLLAQI